MIFPRRYSILYDQHVPVNLKQCKQQLWKLKLKTKFNYEIQIRSLSELMSGINSAVLLSEYYSCLQGLHNLTVG